MIPPPKPSPYYTGCNEALLRAVPAAARRILEVGCAEGYLGAQLKQIVPGRHVAGIEREPAVAARAAQRLDQVLALDVEKDDLPLKPGTLDCILYGDILEHLRAPEEVLRRHRRLLSPGGIILCSIPNVQHHSLVGALLASDWQYTTSGLLDSTHLRFFTYSTIFKLLLDAGFAPSLVETITLPCSREFLAAVEPLLRYLGLHPGRTQRYLEAYQYIFQGTPLPYADKEWPGPADPDGATASAREMPLSFVVCVSDEATLQANLLSSPGLGPGSPHEVLLVRNCRTAAEGYHQGLARARHSLVVCLHQDVYLPRGWTRRFAQQVAQAARANGHLAVVGVYGVARRGTAIVRAGHVVDRDRLLQEPAHLPAVVDTLDELLLALHKNTPLTFDPRLGFHLYGADICLSARQRGLTALVVDALCFHHSRTTDVPPAFYESGAVFAQKWSRQLPIATPCALVDERWRRGISGRAGDVTLASVP